MLYPNLGILLILLTSPAFVLADEAIADTLSLNETETDNKPEAILYDTEDKSENGTWIRYTDYMTDFHDVPRLLQETDMQKAALLCVKGVFILYNDDAFTATRPSEMMVLAGKDLDTCVHPGQMESLMCLQNNIDIFHDSLAVFRDEKFAGTPFENHLIIDHQNEYDNHKLARLGKVESFVMMGKEGWMVTLTSADEKSTDSTVYCLRPSLQSEYPICPVPRATKYIKDTGTWTDARRGCTDFQAKQIELDHCFDYGAQLQPVSNDPADFENETQEAGPPPGEVPPAGPPGETGEVNKTAEPVVTSDLLSGECDDDITELAILLRLRLTHDFMSEYQVQFPLNKAHSWRTEILDNTIEIVRDNVFNGVPNVKLLYFIRELYIYFAEKYVWSEGRGWPSKPKQRVMLVAHETQRCLSQIRAKQWSGLTGPILTTMAKAFEGHEIPDSSIDKEFASSSSFDVVMEFIWLSINFVGAACHTALQFQTDFWMDYMNVAYDMYLEPMAEFWANPKKLVEIYEIIFGGLDLEFQHRSLCAITSALYKAIRLDKLPRPMSVEDAAIRSNSTSNR